MRPYPVIEAVRWPGWMRPPIGLQRLDAIHQSARLEIGEELLAEGLGSGDDGAPAADAPLRVGGEALEVVTVGNGLHLYGGRWLLPLAAASSHRPLFCGCR